MFSGCVVLLCFVLFAKFPNCKQLFWQVSCWRIFWPSEIIQGLAGTPQHGRSPAPGRKAEGKGLVHGHKERTALTTNQVIMAASSFFLCRQIQCKHSKSQSKGVSHLCEHSPDFPSQFPAFTVKLPLARSDWVRLPPEFIHAISEYSQRGHESDTRCTFHFFPSLLALENGLHNIITICCL